MHFAALRQLPELAPPLRGRAESPDTARAQPQRARLPAERGPRSARAQDPQARQQQARGSARPHGTHCAGPVGGSRFYFSIKYSKLIKLINKIIRFYTMIIIIMV